ncbi:MAG: hypothetical protein ACI4JY_11190 [Oscillospiraceae bacterium]
MSYNEELLLPDVPTAAAAEPVCKFQTPPISLFLYNTKMCKKIKEPKLTIILSLVYILSPTRTKLSQIIELRFVTLHKKGAENGFLQMPEPNFWHFTQS